MAGSAKLFKYYQRYNQILGFTSPKPNGNPVLLNSKNVILLISLAQYFMSTAASMLFEAQSVVDYGTIVSYLVLDITIATEIFLSIYQMEKTSKFIESCEQFVARSKMCI